MASPFRLIRKHQRILTVVLTGLAMFAFVILGMGDPTAMPTALTVIALACLVGGVGWLIGMTTGSRKTHKASEYGIIGLILGLVVGTVVTLTSGPANAIDLNSDSISQKDLSELQQNRSRANSVVQQLFYRANQDTNNAFAFQQLQNYLFSYGVPNPAEDVLIEELLSREADRLGIVVTDHSVNRFLQQVTNDKVTADDVSEVRTQLGLSESELYGILANGLKARRAAEYLYPGTTLPPEAYWDFYKKMNVSEELTVVPIPVSAFIDETAQPSDSDLAELFEKYRDNFPNVTPEGELEEGRPGFRQPRQVRLAYLEAVYADVEPTIPPITEAEVEEYYEEEYKKPAEGAAPPFPLDQPKPGADATGPKLGGPQLGGPKMQEPGGDETPQGDAAADAPKAPTDEGSPAPRKPSDASSEKPAESPAVKELKLDDATDTKGSDAESTDAKPEDTTSDEGAGGNGAADGDAVKETEVEPTSAIAPPQADRMLVAFQEDQEDAVNEVATDEEAPTEPDAKSDDAARSDAPADKPQSDDKADAPAGEGKAKEGDATKNDAKSEDAPAGKETSDTADTPDAEAMPDETTDEPDMEIEPAIPEVPPLEDDLREEIRDQILREKTVAKIEEMISDAVLYMATDLSSAGLRTDDPNYMTPAAAAEELRAYAEKHGLIYQETPLLSFDDLASSQDHPIGSAIDPTVNSFQSQVLNVAQQSFIDDPEELFRAQQARDIQTESQFAYWKIEDQPQFAAQSMEAPSVHDAVVKAWRIEQAQPKARARAETIAKLINQSDKPIEEALADMTVTGADDGQALTAVDTGRFSWLSRPNVPSPNPFNQPAPTMANLPMLDGVGQSFLKTVFNELDHGETGVAANRNKQVFFAVKVHNRQPAMGDEALATAFRKQFMSQQLFGSPMFSDYGKLANNKLRTYMTGYRDELYGRYGVNPDQVDALGDDFR